MLLGGFYLREMIVNPKVITPPENEPVTVDEAKMHLHVDGTYEDDYISQKITTARQLCEKYSQLSFLTQELVIRMERFPRSRYIQLPRGPVQEITDFVYINSDGDSIPMTEGTDFILDTNSETARVEYVGSWPSANCEADSVSISYNAGYVDDEDDPLPGIIKEAILKTVARLYEKKGDSSDGPVLTEDITDMLDMVKVYYNAHVL